MYDAPRFQEDRLRPRGSSTVQAGSRGPTHCWPVSDGCPAAIRSASKVKSSEAQRSPSPSDRPVSVTAAAAREPRRSPRPRWSGLAAKTTSSARRGSAASASDRSGRQTAAVTASPTTTATTTMATTGSLGSPSSRSVRPPSIVASAVSPNVTAETIRRSRHGASAQAERTSAKTIVATRPTTWAILSGGTRVNGVSLRPIDAGQSTTTHARDPSRTADAAIAGARTGSARQRTANASTRLGTASTR